MGRKPAASAKGERHCPRSPLANAAGSRTFNGQPMLTARAWWLLFFDVLLLMYGLRFAQPALVLIGFAILIWFLGNGSPSWYACISSFPD